MSNTSRMMQTAAAGVPGDKWTLNDVKTPFQPLGQTQIDPNAYQVVWRPNGNSFFIIDNNGFTSFVKEYIAPSQWEITPHVDNSNSNFFFLGYNNFYGLWFKPDGTKMYTTEKYKSPSPKKSVINEYTLSTAWDLTTASLVNTFDTGFEDDSIAYYIPTCIDVQYNNFHVSIFSGTTSGSPSYSYLIRRYNMSTPWDISTTFAFSTKNFSDTYWGFSWNTNGTKIVLARYGTNVNPFFDQYSIIPGDYGNAWNISALQSSPDGTFSDYGWYSNTTSQSFSSSRSLRYPFFGEYGDKFYLTTFSGSNANPKALYSYYLPQRNDIVTEAPVRQYAAGSYYKWPGINTRTSLGVTSLCFSRDGLNMYSTDTYNGRIFQFSLSQPYQVSTASYASFAGTGGFDIGISRDGTKVFLLDSYGTRIITYTLSTPFDLSSSVVTSNDIIPFSTSPGYAYTFFIREDGLKLYTASSNKLQQFTLGTAYDMSTLSWDGLSTANAISSTTNILGMRISGDGKKMILTHNVGTGQNSTYVREYSLASPWDLTSDPTLNNTYDVVSNQETGGYYRNGNWGLDVSSDGSYLFLPMRGMDLLLQYTLK